MFDSSSVDQIKNSQTYLVDSLNESFKNQHFLMKLEDTHPLFKHAQLITKNYRYVPKQSVSFTIFAKTYKTKEDARDSKNKIFYFKDNSPLLEKDIWIRFTADVAGLNNYKVMWQVTNTGDEASKCGSGELRGDFYECEKGFTRTKIEHTSYSGTHFVQAFLIDKSTGSCVKKSNILTINIGA